MSRTLSDIFRIDEKFIHQLSAMFTCRDGKGGELSNRASKMLYKPPGAVYIASYKERLDQSDCGKLYVQLRNYTNYTYNFFRFILNFCLYCTCSLKGFITEGDSFLLQSHIYDLATSIK